MTNRRPRADWLAIRIRAGVSLPELERSTGIDRRMLARYELGIESPPPSHRALMLRAIRPRHPGTRSAELERSDLFDRIVTGGESS